jgi:cell division septal protein FtsQ
MKLPRFAGPLDKLNEIYKRYNQLAPLVQAACLHIQEFGCNVRKTWYIRINKKMTLKLGRGESKAQLQRFLKVYHLVMPSLKKMGHKLLMVLIPMALPCKQCWQSEEKHATYTKKINCWP